MKNIETKVLNILKSAPNRVNIPNCGANWVNLAGLGALLKSEGIDYNSLGFDKLATFIDSLNGVEMFKDERGHLPVVYVREIQNIPQENRKEDVRGKRLSTPSQMLFDWAYMGHYPTTINKLKEMALKEDWGGYQNDEGNTIYPVLNSYLRYTFFRLNKETNKIFYSKNRSYAVFNTGLVNHSYMQIFALFEKNRNASQPWYFVDFCVEGEGRSGKILVNDFEAMPMRAHYFSKVSDMLYDTNQTTPPQPPQLDLNHIIVDRVDRLPYEFIRENGPFDFEISRTDCMTGEERKTYYENLRDAIKEDSKAMRRLSQRLKDALETSLKRVEWNFKSAIPMYYPKKDKMCLFLPLCLVDEEKVDVALVVEKTDSGRYLGVTIYELSWAYKCARLVCRPDSDWLTVNYVHTDDE
ncbi:MAG: DUF3825 domain-containing protein [Bacteroidales bacterium]|nr:DUF3825 domain-containing protein [Candidatus Colimorpha merdihippi]